VSLRIATVHLENQAISKIWLDLLDAYAKDPMGGGEGLSDYAKANLVERLKNLPGFHGALAFMGETPVGLINCFTGFSTFAAKPLLNIHDVVVLSEWRGQGIASALLDWAEECANQLGCCKLTLEILSNNTAAMASYRRAGFVPYELDPAAGHALLMQKSLEEKK
jgi:GNAT superfamily N-acetyltransferase